MKATKFELYMLRTKNWKAVARMKRVVKSHNFCEWPDGYKWKYTLRHNSSVHKKLVIKF